MGSGIDCQNHYDSKEQVVEQWLKLIRSGEEVTPAMQGLPANFRLVYAPGTGWKYSVSLARTQDQKALEELSTEFIDEHVKLYSDEPDFKGVDYQAWSRYLGFPNQAAKGLRQALDNFSKAPSQVHRLSVHNFRQGGCVLKCEAECEGQVTPRRRRSDYESDTPVKPQGIVGYVHFFMEDGTEEGGMRHSKRLQKKRGEATHEYTKVSHLVVHQAHTGDGLARMLMTAMMQCVRLLEPTYTKEVFLTVMQQNERAVQLYTQVLGLRLIGENTTYLVKERNGHQSRPVVWYQLGLTRECLGGPGAERSDRSRSQRRIQRQVGLRRGVSR